MRSSLDHVRHSRAHASSCPVFATSRGLKSSPRRQATDVTGHADMPTPPRKPRTMVRAAPAELAPTVDLAGTLWSSSNNASAKTAPDSTANATNRRRLVCESQSDVVYVRPRLAARFVGASRQGLNSGHADLGKRRGNQAASGDRYTRRPARLADATLRRQAAGRPVILHGNRRHPVRERRQVECRRHARHRDPVENPRGVRSQPRRTGRHNAQNTL